ncbi:elongation factor 1-gamma (EF-1-gamma), putative [Trypanosoma cruzi]|uniref:Elongation factor 1-gamma (EF-1-gamma), putative n=1 Tax=Trypanosoma cruzi (strain CL Brener) TaxID=353153 RepID=Q4DN01_TRYCC|nr:elongation factor 1-gamma (EF-1-gamma), putative [Trypanosoma cruzi]EAN93903.1 elongation factor 1-gamma (EF-1-gamma), putative [Trypanosoma cruzi]|eukprot:XP_815754.1 elongation factor 1-gamma (EF-1-gamma) [Trypanosoma cruzi strain CL Brener]
MQCMTANLIGMCLQRMEHVRQYLLGVALMIVEERRHDVVALCVFCAAVACRRLCGTWSTRSCLTGEEVADVAAQRECMTNPRPVLGGARVEVSVACL